MLRVLGVEDVEACERGWLDGGWDGKGVRGRGVRGNGGRITGPVYGAGGGREGFEGVPEEGGGVSEVAVGDVWLAFERGQC